MWFGTKTEMFPTFALRFLNKWLATNDSNWKFLSLSKAIIKWKIMYLHHLGMAVSIVLVVSRTTQSWGEYLILLLHSHLTSTSIPTYSDLSPISAFLVFLHSVTTYMKAVHEKWAGASVWVHFISSRRKMAKISWGHQVYVLKCKATKRKGERDGEIGAWGEWSACYGHKCRWVAKVPKFWSHGCEDAGTAVTLRTGGTDSHQLPTIMEPVH